MKILNRLLLSRKLNKIEKHVKFRTELLATNFMNDTLLSYSYDSKKLSDFIDNIHEIYKEELMDEIEED